MSKSRQQNKWFDEDDLEYERDSFANVFGNKTRKEVDKLERRREEQRKAQQSKENSFDDAIKNNDWD